MKIRTHKSSIKTIKPMDPAFHFSDGFFTAPRAGFEISMSCPYQYREVIQTCISNGWLKPVAYMTEREMMVNGLLND